MTDDNFGETENGWVPTDGALAAGVEYHPPTAARARRYRRLAAALVITGLLIFLGSHLLARETAAWLQSELGVLPELDPAEALALVSRLLAPAFSVLGLLVAASAFFCILFAKRLAATSAREELSRDPRAPVLYLRSFIDERLWQGPGMGNWEGQFARVLQDVGPVIAIGKPGEKLPLLGAARWQVDSSGWQAEVQRLLPQAGLVVIRVGETAGLWWEVEQALQFVKPERLLILLPARPRAFQLWCARLEALLRRPFPRTGVGKPLIIPRRDWLWGLGPSWLLYFAADGTPHLVGTQKVPFGGRAFHGKLATFEYEFRSAIQPLFAQLGVAWTPPRQPWARVFTVTGGLLIWPLAMFFMLGAFMSQHFRTAGSVPRESIYRQVAAEYGARVLRHPEMAARYANLPEREIPGVVARLMHDGLPQLTDEELKRRAELEHWLLVLADVSSCAAMVRGAGETIPPAVLNMLGVMDRSALEEWFAIQEQALLAGLRGPGSAAEPSDPEIDRSSAELLDRLPAHDAQRLQRAMRHLGDVPEGEACWAGRTLLAGMIQLPEPSRSVLSRARVLER